MARTLDISQLVTQPDSMRDEEWEKAFLLAFPTTTVEIIGEQPQVGPDGWPYLHVKTDITAAEPATKVLNWLASRGIGLAVNPHKHAPDYVFTYGMVWNLKQTGQFYTAANKVSPGAVKYEKGQQVHAGEPAEEYLPAYVRDILRQFFKQQGVKSPKIMVMSSNDKNYDLCFSLESLGDPPTHEHHGIAEAVSWFLPAHYSIVLISEESVPAFIEL